MCIYVAKKIGLHFSYVPVPVSNEQRGTFPHHFEILLYTVLKITFLILVKDKSRQAWRGANGNKDTNYKPVPS